MDIRLAPADPLCKKAFDCATKGEVLGIEFDTKEMTGKLPWEKIVVLVRQLVEASAETAELTFNEVECIFGKLTHVAQHKGSGRRYSCIHDRELRGVQRLG